MASKTKNAVFVLIISLVMAALRTVIVVTNMEKSTPRTDLYYLPQNAVVVAFTVASLVLLAVFAFMAFRFSGKARVALDDRSAAVSVGALIVSFSLIGVGIMYLWSLFSDSAIDAADAMAIMGADEKRGVSAVEIIAAVFAGISAIKFFVQGLYNSRHGKHNPFTSALVMLAPIMLSAFRLLNDFVNSSAAPMASSGAYHIVSLVAVLLFFLSEGKSYVVETRSFLFDLFGYSSVYLLLVYSVPNIIIRCIGVFSFDTESAMSIVDLAIAIYIVTRLITTKKLRPKPEQLTEIE